MAIQRIAVPPRLQVSGGKSISINAVPVGAGKQEKALLYYVIEGEGEVDKSGVFTAPASLTDKITKVKVISAFDSSQEAIVEITVKAIAPLKISPSANLVALGGKEIQFQTKFELPANIYWHVIDFNRDTGNIDANSGLYKAPEIILSNKSIKIEAIDQNRTNNKAEVEIELLPVEMRVGAQRRIHVGEKDIQLAIASHNDLNGLNNFTCAIVSRPIVGQVVGSGLYSPPKRINRLETIKVEATSNLDRTKRINLEFEVGFPFCPKCKIEETDVYGNCPNCGPVLSSVIKPKKCPRCGSSHYDDTNMKCPDCNYPKSRKSR